MPTKFSFGTARACAAAALLVTMWSPSSATVSCTEKIDPQSAPALDFSKPVVVQVTWERLDGVDAPLSFLRALRTNRFVIERKKIETPGAKLIASQVVGTLGKVMSQGEMNDMLAAVARQVGGKAKYSVTFAQASALPDFTTPSKKPKAS